MITVEFRRFEAHDGYEYPSLKREMTPSHAAVNLLRNELGWGGRIIELDTTSIAVRTPCFGKVDKDTYSGPADEMQLLHRAVDIWAHLKGVSNVMTEIAAERIGQLVSDSPNIAGMMSAVIGNTSVVNMALSQLAGLSDTQRSRALKIKHDELDPLIELVLETGCSFDECLEAAA